MAKEGEDETLKSGGPLVTVSGLQPEAGAWTAHLEMKRESPEQLAATLTLDRAEPGRAQTLATPAASLMFTKAPPPEFGGPATTLPFSGKIDESSGSMEFTVSKQESFRGTFNGSQIIDGQVLWLGTPLESIALKEKELLPGFSFEYAPLANEKETRAWLDTMSTGKIVEWQLPTAFDPSMW